MTDNVAPLTRPPERWVSRTEIARIMGVAPRTITNMVAQGMPSETWGLRARRFLPSECVRWAQLRGRNVA